MSFIKRYDPAKFGLTFALKATITFILAVFLGYIFGTLTGAVYAANAVICIFFIDSLDGTTRHKFALLLAYIALGSLAIIFVKATYSVAFLILVPTFLWLFCVQAINAFSANFYKILHATTMCGTVTLIMLTSLPELVLTDAIFGFVIGGFLATFFRLARFGKYGKFTAKIHTLLLSDLIKMSEEIKEGKDFDKAAETTHKHINEFKAIFEHRSSTIKDAQTIIYHSKSIFYLYKLEDIFHALISLKSYQHKVKDKDLVERVFCELTQNLKELKKIFVGGEVELKNEAFLCVQETQWTLFASSLKVAYDKFRLIKEGGEDKLNLQSKPPKSFYKFVKNFSLKGESALSSLRIATSVTLAIFIALVTKIDHGVWIAIGVLTITKNSAYLTLLNGIDQIKGNIVGLFFGLMLVFGLKNLALAYFVVLLAFIFLAFYLKLFPVFYFSVAFMTAFVMIFYLMQHNFVELVLLRVVDILAGFLIAFALSFAFKNHSNRLILKAKFTKTLNLVSELMLFKSFVKVEKDAIGALQEYKLAIRQSDKRGIAALRRSLTLFKSLHETNLLISNLRDYTKIRAIRGESDFLNDTKIIITRFEMIKKKIDKLPNYFYDDLEDKWFSKDEKLLYILRRIANEQRKIYDAV